MDIHEYGIHPRDRSIYILDDEITPEVACRTVKNLHRLDNGRPIRIYLSTDGGDVAAGLTIYQAIRAATSKVEIVGMGHVESIGVLIFQAGDRRLVHETTSLMYHEGTVSFSGPPEETRKQAAAYFRHNEMLDRILYQRKKGSATFAEFKDEVRSSIHLIGEEIVKYGWADGIERG